MVDPEQFDFLVNLEQRRQDTITQVMEQGGFDLSTLGEPERGDKGNGIEFFSLEGITIGDTALGFKRYRPNSLMGYYSTAYANKHNGFTLDIATMRLMGLRSHIWAGMLPFVHYEVLGNDGEPMGILTEDFSEHGRLRSSGSTWLNTYPKLFENPDVVDSDHLDNVVGIFENFSNDPVKVDKRKIIDVQPLYDKSLIYDAGGDYVEWFAETLDLENVASRIDGCRVKASELTK